MQPTATKYSTTLQQAPHQRSCNCKPPIHLLHDTCAHPNHFAICTCLHSRICPTTCSLTYSLQPCLPCMAPPTHRQPHPPLHTYHTPCFLNQNLGTSVVLVLHCTLKWNDQLHKSNGNENYIKSHSSSQYTTPLATTEQQVLKAGDRDQGYTHKTHVHTQQRTSLGLLFMSP